ncbi:MAG: acylphosphatase, partial [Actinomycetota bacterium]
PKPFRGTLAGIDVALLDIAARAHGAAVSALLGEQRSRVGVSAVTIPTPRNRGEFAYRARRGARRFPVTRFEGTGDVDTDLDLLRLAADANRSAGAEKPVWVDVNEAFEPAQAMDYVDGVTDLMCAGGLPAEVIVEQPVAREHMYELVKLQRRADARLAGRRRRRTVPTLWRGRGSPSRWRNAGPLRLTIVADESVWDADDLRRLQRLAGCGGVNINVAEAGGLLAAWDVAQEASRLDPEARICLGGMPATSDITSWAVRNLAVTVPRLDYFTIAPLGHAEAGIAEPRLRYRHSRTHLLADQEDEGIGAELSLAAVGPYVSRSARFPVPAGAAAQGGQPNRFDVPFLERFGKLHLDSHLLEYEALCGGLETVRYSPTHFAAGERAEQPRIGFTGTAGVETSRVGSHLAGDRHLTRVLLERAGVTVPAGRRFATGQREAALAYAAELGWPVVLKPQAGSGGRAVRTDIRSADELARALDAVAEAGCRELLVERHANGAAYRFVVLRDRVLSVLYRRPANVVGDGASTVAELIGQQNELRAGARRLQAHPLRIDDRVRLQLERQGLAWDSVPAVGRRVQVSTSCGVSRGGESFQVLDEAHPTLLDEAVRAVRALPGLTYAGVDMVLADHRRPLAEQAVAVCEINAAPSGRTSHFPLYGPSRNVSRELLADQCDRAGLPLGEGADELCLDLEVRGVVQEVGYRHWMKGLAREFGVAGWARDTVGTDLVEACVAGPAGPVAALASLAISGPPRARPDHVVCRHHDGEIPQGRFGVKR